MLQLARNSPISRALQDMARALVGDGAAEQKGWLARILQRT